MKYLYSFFFFGILLLVFSCTGPRMIRTPVNIYSEIDTYYNINAYNLVLETADSVFYLTDGKVLSNGKILASGLAGPNGKKEMTFHSNSMSYDVVEYVTDSFGNKTGQLRFSESGIYEVEEKVKRRAGPDKRIIYSEGLSRHETVLVLLCSLAAGALIIFASVFINNNRSSR